VLAYLILKGKNWARIVLWAFAGLVLIFGLLALVRPAGALSLTVGLLGVGLDAAVIVLLARRSSSAFFSRR